VNFFYSFYSSPSLPSIFWIFWCKMKITDAPTIWIECHPIQTNWCPHLCHPTIFALDALPGTTLTIYHGLEQAPNMPACIPGGLVHPGFKGYVKYPSVDNCTFPTECVCLYVSSHILTRSPAKARFGRPYGKNGRFGGHIGETGSSNTAATQKINFLTPVSYSLLQTLFR